MILRETEGTWIWKRKQEIALFKELALEEFMDLSQEMSRWWMNQLEIRCILSNAEQVFSL